MKVLYVDRKLTASTLIIDYKDYTYRLYRYRLYIYLHLHVLCFFVVKLFQLIFLPDSTDVLEFIPTPTGVDEKAKVILFLLKKYPKTK